VFFSRRWTTLVDIAGRRRSAATLPGYHHGRPPRNKGVQYPPDPPTVEEIIAVMRAAGDDADGVRLRGLIIVWWRAGLRISEALALTESELDGDRGAVLIRRGKGGKRREVGMDRWAWEQLAPWLTLRSTLPVGALFCVLRGPTRGRPWAPAGVRVQLHDAAPAPECDGGSPHTSCATPTQWRCRARASPLLVIQRQPGHANLAITSGACHEVLPQTMVDQTIVRAGAKSAAATDVGGDPRSECQLTPRR
jgi:integrase